MDYIFIAISPILGTLIGTIISLFSIEKYAAKTEKALQGFNYAILFVLIIFYIFYPGLLMNEWLFGIPFILPLLCFFIGLATFFLLDNIIPHHHMYADHPEGSRLGPEGVKVHLKTNTVIIQRVPKGILYAVILNLAYYEKELMTFEKIGIFSFSFFLLNIGETILLGRMYIDNNISKIKTFKICFTIGLVEYFIIILLGITSSFVDSMTPYLLFFLFGAFVYLIVDDIAPRRIKKIEINYTYLAFFLALLIIALFAFSMYRDLIFK